MQDRSRIVTAHNTGRAVAASRDDGGDSGVGTAMSMQLDVMTTPHLHVGLRHRLPLLHLLFENDAAHLRPCCVALSPPSVSASHSLFELKQPNLGQDSTFW